MVSSRITPTNTRQAIDLSVSLTVPHLRYRETSLGHPLPVLQQLILLLVPLLVLQERHLPPLSPLDANKREEGNDAE